MSAKLAVFSIVLLAAVSVLLGEANESNDWRLVNKKVCSRDVLKEYDGEYDCYECCEFGKYGKGSAYVEGIKTGCQCTQKFTSRLEAKKSMKTGDELREYSGMFGQYKVHQE